VLRQTPKSSLVSIAACAAESIRPFFGSGEGVLVHGFIWDIFPENFSRKPAFLVHRFLGHKYLQYLFSIPWEPRKNKTSPDCAIQLLRLLGDSTFLSAGVNFSLGVALLEVPPRDGGSLEATILAGLPGVLLEASFPTGAGFSVAPFFAVDRLGVLLLEISLTADDFSVRSDFFASDLVGVMFLGAASCLLGVALSAVFSDSSVGAALDPSGFFGSTS